MPMHDGNEFMLARFPDKSEKLKASTVVFQDFRCIIIILGSFLLKLYRILNQIYHYMLISFKRDILISL